MKKYVNRGEVLWLEVCFPFWESIRVGDPGLHGSRSGEERSNARQKEKVLWLKFGVFMKMAEILGKILAVSNLHVKSSFTRSCMAIFYHCVGLRSSAEAMRRAVSIALARR
jgi:hypothetical protein